MKKNSILIVILSLMIVSVSIFHSKTADAHFKFTADDEELVLGGVYVGMDIDDVLGAYGAPTEMEPYYNVIWGGTAGEVQRKYQWKPLLMNVWTGDKTIGNDVTIVHSVHVGAVGAYLNESLRKNPKIQEIRTPAGIYVGMPAEKALAVYGITLEQAQQENIQNLKRLNLRPGQPGAFSSVSIWLYNTDNTQYMCIDVDLKVQMVTKIELKANDK